jgi:DNA-binding CsgD family transcriptional regulator
VVRPLTQGELRALQASARYETTREAAAAIGITEGTMRNLMSRAFRKLEVPSRTAAYRRMGWLRPPTVLKLK